MGVEEQYYLIVPILLIFFWKYGERSVIYLLCIIFLASFCFAIFFVNYSPKWAFYILPTRAWEICIGGLAALYVFKNSSLIKNSNYSDALSLAGFLLIVFAIFYFDKSIISLGYFLLIPTIGAVLIIVFCRSESFVFKILGSKVFVFVGLLSYSLYLWHQPVFAFFRVYSLEHPSPLHFLAFFPVIFILAFFTWKFIESPFRRRSFIGYKGIFVFSIFGSISFVVFGLYLNKNYGIPSRVFDENISIGDMDKRIYNEKAFSYKKDEFHEKSLTNILIVGDSFARDFLNMTLESFVVDNVEIIYRNDIGQCVQSSSNKIHKNLLLGADVIVFSSSIYDKNCYLKDISFGLGSGKMIFYVGTKNFGYNLNWLARLSKDNRPNQFNSIPDGVVIADKEMVATIPSKHYISLLEPTLINGKVPITDESGRMLSTDRTHLTKYGAIYFGKKVFFHSSYSDFFK